MRPALAALACLFLLAPNSTDAASFVPLVPQVSNAVNPRGLTPDGRVVWLQGNPPFGEIDWYGRWTAAGGYDDLTPTFELDREFIGAGTSVDGRAVAGQAFMVLNGQLTDVAMRWTEGAGAQPLGFLPGGVASIGTGISGDGRTVVGYSAVNLGSRGAQRAFRWTEEGGMSELPPSPGDAQSWAYAISRDGSTVVGVTGDNLFPTFRRMPARWRGDGAPEELSLPPGATAAAARTVSATGDVIAGGATPMSGSGGRGFRWTPATGSQLIGVAAGHSSSDIVGMNGDGSILVGSGGVPGVISGQHAIMWTETTGPIDLNVYFASLGIDLMGYVLNEAIAVSDDGLTFVGRGSIQNGPTPSDRIDRAWIVTIPAPTALLPLSCGWIALRRRR